MIQKLAVHFRTVLYVQNTKYKYMRPDLSRVASFCHNYISQVAEPDLNEAFINQSRAFTEFIESIPPGKLEYRYAEGKWTIKELLQHIIDVERVFAYRALRFARKDTTPLPGFDENNFAKHAKTEKRNWSHLVEEFKAVRKSTELLFQSFDEEQLESGGISSNQPNYVRAIGFIIIGHVLHHTKIIRERYLCL